jgi:hypothetical protein
MLVDLKPYPAYKDSRVPWLGMVPEHWGLRRLKYVLRERDTRSPSGTEQLLRVSQYTGVTQRRRADGADEPDTRAESLVGYKRVEPNELVVNIMLAWNGSMGVSVTLCVKHILRKHGYPPDKQEKATQTVLGAGGGPFRDVGSSVMLRDAYCS